MAKIQHVPTEGHPFVSSAEAQSLALDALFISRSRNLGFEDVFWGGLSKYYQPWAISEAQNGRVSGAAHHLEFLRHTERERSIFDDPKNNIWMVIENDVEPLRRVLEGVMSGGSQDQAMTRVAEAYVKYRHMLSADEEFDVDLPRATKHTSKSRLGPLWAKYADIFHYVLIWHVGFQRARKGWPLENLPDARPFQQKMAQLICGHKRTKPIRLPQPLFLNFVTIQEYAVLTKDS